MTKRLGLGLLSCAIIASSFTAATAATINLHVQDSHGNPLPGVSAQLVTSQFLSVGTTDANGDLVINCADNLMHKIKVSYMGTTAISPAYVSSGVGTTSQTFETSELTILTKSGNTPVAGVGLSFIDHSNSWRSLGASDINGMKVVQIFGKDSTRVRANANGSYNDRFATPFGYGQDDTVCFSNLVSVLIPNTYLLVGSSWFTPNGRYLFPGKYLAKVLNQYTDSVDVSSNFAGKVPVVIIVKDHNGNPIAGVPLRGGIGNGIQWHATPTNANGVTIDWTPANANTNRTYEASVNVSKDTITQNTAVAGGNIFNFKTSLLVAKLLDCNGGGIAGGHIRWGVKQINSHFPNANGVNTDANGTTTAEAFPGCFTMEMGINQGTQTKTFYFNGLNCIVWNTVNVTTPWAGNVSYSSNPSGNNAWFVKTGTPMLVGNYYFKFFTGSNGTVMPVTIVAGCEQEVNGPASKNSTSVTDLLSDDVFRMYPNPAVSTITVETDTEETIKIVAMNGQTVLSVTAKAGVNTLDVSTLPVGTYIISLGNQVEKLIKQ